MGDSRIFDRGLEMQSPFAVKKQDFSWGKLDDEGMASKLSAISDKDAEETTHLFLQRNNLTKFPDLGRFKNVRLLDVSHNAIDSEVNLRSLPKLRTLYLQGNSLTGLPKGGDKSKLEVLWLEDNIGLASKAVNVGKPFHEDPAAIQALYK